MRTIKVLDLFAGAGGYGLGFSLASRKYKLICSLEVDKWAVKTLKANNKHKQKIILGDIRHFNTAEKIYKACPNSPNVIIGGPPCQGFSLASSSKDPKDPRNSLFKNFAQWVNVLRPEVFAMENVKGFLTGENEKGEKIIDIIEKRFRKIGYTINIWELNAANYGVPQRRERIFIVGTKFGIKIPKPPKTHYLPEQKKELNGHVKKNKLQAAIKVSKAINDLPKLKAGEGEEEAILKTIAKNGYQKNSRGNLKKVYNHVTMSHTKRMVERYEQILQGFSLEEISEELQVRERNGKISKVDFNSNYRHLKPNMISHTIPASFYSNFVHPTQPRNITSREAARLQSFPDNYIFKGKRTQISSKLLKQLGKEDENYLSQYNQIGNAVPPLLAKAVAKQILKYLKGNAKKKY
jgi:DNA (cytosine-5)-methyltransferase 1